MKFSFNESCPSPQILWGTSGIATYVPWAGAGGPYLAVGLWLWLGVLDAVQGVGLGLILLQTLSRLHVTVTLAFSQVLGSAIVMIARATAPDALGPGTVFPDPGIWDPQNGLSGSPMASPMFWVCLVCQLIIVAGYFWFYRREELGEPINSPFFRSMLSLIRSCSTTLIVIGGSSRHHGPSQT